jgi:hypothetical protein
LSDIQTAKPILLGMDIALCETKFAEERTSEWKSRAFREQFKQGDIHDIEKSYSCVFIAFY